jgi:hypothetical protein
VAKHEPSMSSINPLPDFDVHCPYVWERDWQKRRIGEPGLVR